MSSGARSVFAVIDGFLLFLALEGVFYAIALLGLGRSFDTPTPGYLLCNLIWTVIAAGIAGYVTGMVARHSPVAHGAALAIPFVLLAIFNIIKGLGSRRTPFVLGWNVLVPLCCILGAWLYSKHRPRAALSRRR